MSQSHVLTFEDSTDMQGLVGAGHSGGGAVLGAALFLQLSLAEPFSVSLLLSSGHSLSVIYKWLCPYKNLVYTNLHTFR